MASGDVLVAFGPHSAEFPSSGFATPDLRNAHPVLDFDASADEAVAFSGVLTGGTSGITVNLLVAASSATSGASRWQVALERLNTAGPDIDADSYGTEDSVGITASGTSGIPTVGSIALTGGELDSIAKGDAFRLRVRRDADGTSGTDDMTGDAELLMVSLTET
jgi:hypothetical protein